VAVNRDRWDLDAIRAGALVALVFAIPFSIAARWAADRDRDDGLALWLSLGALAGFVLGAGCAAWVQRVGLPLKHALVTALGTYAAAQAVFVIVKLVRGGDVNWLGVLFTGSTVAGAGLIGGVFGRRLRDKGFRPTGAEPS
jgi:hypothetical protein